jgi:alpha-1,2-mannosyltransferase
LANTLEVFSLKIGIFHPTLNLCGGGEWVALNIINSLRQNGHEVVVLTDERLSQEKFMKTFGRKLQSDREIIFPFHFFSRGDPHNIYTDIISCILLKSKCDIVIDTYTCLVLPKTDVVYMHYPLFKQSTLQEHVQQIKTLAKMKNALFFLPYRVFEKKLRKKNKQLILANSEFTSRAVKLDLGLQAHILYPPLSGYFLQSEEKIYSSQRLDQVVTVSRFAPEKNLEIIPSIAKQMRNTRFLIIGNLQYKTTYSNLLKLIKDLNVENRVSVMPGLPKTKLKQILLESKIYLHCAKNEHFGVSVIDAMASGCIPIVHDSGGPKEFVPESLRYTSIAEAIERINQAIVEWSPLKALEARNSTLKFCQEIFSDRLLSLLSLHGLLDKK